MKKNKFFRLLNRTLMACGLLAMGACSGGSNGGGGDEPAPKPAENVTLRSTSIKEGAEVEASVDKLTLSYSTTVQVSAKADITLNGKSVSAASSSKTTMDVEVNLALEEGKSYTLKIAAGSIVARDDNSRTAPEFTLNFTTKKAPSMDLPDNDAMKVTHMIGFGWNLGNHFDSYDGGNAKDNYRITWSKDCPYWDGKIPTEKLYKSLAAAGVKTVRMPVTWGPYQNMTDGNYTIDADYMATVKQNVLWAKAAGLNVVLNTHHDEYWQDAYGASTSTTLNDELKVRITATWTQIATAFKDEGDYLILETFNELNHNWASPTSGELKIQNEWNQVAVDAIRAVGGANATRWIAVPSYQANPGQALSSAFKIPNDAANKLIVAIHCYDPYSFTLEKESNKDDADLKVKKWGHNAGNSYDEKNITDLFAKIKAAFIDKNIPVYLGEFGCSRHKTDLGNRCRDYYLEYFCRACCFYGLACCLWDNQNPGGGSEHHAYFNHADGSWCDNHEAIVKTMVKAATSNDATYTLESIYARAPK